ncbi:MAG: helix-turn-helix domain-containing protein [Rhodobacteraceae bacterium]|nr:helix-turn-helix domain-containing protein [Paracoccaceae bacterium]
MSDDAPKDDWFSDAAATFGDRLSGAREAAGMSQADLARRLGVRLRTVEGWEADTIEPRANRLQMLAGLLNVSIRWLLTGEGDGIPGPDAGGGVPPEAARLMAELRSLRGEMLRNAERLGRVEKQLRSALEAAR